MTVYQEDLMNNILRIPYEEGGRSLSVVTGYASPPFILHLLQSMDELELKVTIGMAKHDSINIWDHNEYNNMVNIYGDRLSIKYYIGSKPIHSKLYLWESKLFATDTAFVGSPNFTRNGFSNFQETIAKVNASEVIHLFQIKDTISCSDSNVDKYINLSYRQDSNDIDSSALKQIVREREYVDLTLTAINDNRVVPEKSGLNWGQRPGRERNQAYIPIPKRIHNEKPNFFPHRSERFTLLTDDGESFVCVIAQDNSKAIESSYDNSIIGRYFRRRLGLNEGEFVFIETLDNYGRNFVRIHKIDEETYFMDFS